MFLYVHNSVSKCSLSTSVCHALLSNKESKMRKTRLLTEEKAFQAHTALGTLKVTAVVTELKVFFKVG